MWGCHCVKPDKIYQELKELAEKIGICVSEQNFRITPGIRVRSGFCVVKNRDHCILDKHLKITKKMEILAECIAEQSSESLDNLYIVPAVREYLEKCRPVEKKDHKKVQRENPEAQNDPPEQSESP